MEKRTFKTSKAFRCACKMPANLKHTCNEPFDITQSEVVRWLCAQSDIQSYIFDKANTSGAIVFDPESKTWKGCEA